MVCGPEGAQEGIVEPSLIIPLIEASEYGPRGPINRRGDRFRGWGRLKCGTSERPLIQSRDNQEIIGREERDKSRDMS